MPRRPASAGSSAPGRRQPAPSYRYIIATRLLLVPSAKQFAGAPVRGERPLIDRVIALVSGSESITRRTCQGRQRLVVNQGAHPSMAADPAPWWPWVLPAGWVSALLCSGQRCDALAVDDFATGEPIPRWLGRRGRGAGAGRRSVPEHATSQPGQGPTHDPTLLCQDSSIAYQQVTILRAWATAAGYLNTVGRAARDPFRCPLVTALRPR